MDDVENIATLQVIYVGGTAISDSQVRAFLQRRKSCLVVYKFDELDGWWNNLSVGWKDVFSTQIPIRPASRSEDLHRLIELESVHLDDAPVGNLDALRMFVRLSHLDFSGTAITDLSPLASIGSLVSIHATNSPIGDLSPLRLLTTVEDLDISNTPVEDLKPLSSLVNLKTLNCSGTQIRSIDAVAYLQELESLDFSNTGVKKISALDGLSLKVLKCYNTKLSEKTINKFKAENPECNVIFY